MITRDEVVGEFIISTNRSLLDVDYIQEFIAEKSYWAQGVPREVIDRSINHSLCFGVYHGKKQVGFARIVTDYATFGYLADVFIDEAYRGQGLSKRLMNFIFSLDELKGFRRMLLATRDAHSLYEKYGFRPLRNPSNFMEIHRPDIYLNQKPQQHDGQV